MKSTTEVTNEIRRIVSERVDAGVVIRVEWLTQEILAMKDQIEGDDADFYVACGAIYIKDTVKRCVGDYKPKATAVQDAQIVMDGFDYLQKAYTVERDEEIVLVPVSQLTHAEIEARALELEGMARGCIAHAKELRNYLHSRPGNAA